jgi:hypothetical protein
MSLCSLRSCGFIRRSEPGYRSRSRDSLNPLFCKCCALRELEGRDGTGVAYDTRSIRGVMSEAARVGCAIICLANGPNGPGHVSPTKASTRCTGTVGRLSRRKYDTTYRYRCNMYYTGPCRPYAHYEIRYDIVSNRRGHYLAKY